MYDVSFLIATNSKNYNQLLFPVIDSILSNCPLKVEVVVATGLDLPARPHVRYIHEEEQTGSCAAYNLAGRHATGNYLATTTDDFCLQPNWWEVIEFMKAMNTPCASLFTGAMLNIPVSYMFFLTRELYEGNLMRKHIFNEAYRHCYIDNDLSMRLHFHGVRMESFYKLDPRLNQVPDNDKMSSKTKYFRVDGMVFNKIWGHLPGLSQLCPLYHEADRPDEELWAEAERRVAEDIYRDLYIK